MHECIPPSPLVAQTLTLASLSQGLLATFAQSDIPAFAFLLKLLELTSPFTDGRFRVDSVNVIEVGSGTEPLDSTFHIFSHQFSAPVRSLHSLLFPVDL